MVKKVTGGSQTAGGSLGPFPSAPRRDIPPKPGPPEPGETAEVEDIAPFLLRMLEARLEELVTINTLRLPEEYDRQSAQRVIEDLGDQLRDTLIREIRSLVRQADAVDPGLKIPPRSQAVRLDLSQSRTLDRWDLRSLPPSAADQKVYKGPGRIWQATEAALPRNFVRGGAVRYRINLEQVRFGVMGVRFLDVLSNDSMNSAVQTGSPLEVTYGIVVKDIPWFGSEQPTKVLFVDSLGHPISSLHGRQPGDGKNYLNSPANFAEAKTLEEFTTNSASPYESLRDELLENSAALGSFPSGSNIYEPGVDYVRDIQGLGAMLINGRTDHQVYSQVNGLGNESTVELGGFGRGPTASFPEGLEVLPPVTAEFATIVQQGGRGANFNKIEMRQYQDGLGDDYDVCVGGPAFRWDDVGALRMEDNRFSMALMVLPRRVIEWNDYEAIWGPEASTQQLVSFDMHPAAMWTSAVRYNRQGSRSRRDSAIEMVVI